LARVYLGYAASAIERERLLGEVSRRNRVLESLRAMLETLAGPARVDGGLGVSLAVLRKALGADGVGVLLERDGEPEPRVIVDGAGVPEAAALRDRLQAAAVADVLADGTGGRARLVQPDLAAVPLRHPDGRAALVALASDGDATGEMLELLDDATRSLGLAMEGEALERARREAAALRRSQSIQRELLSSLSHELRTPLTAIRGYASTLRQPDLTWDAESTDRFTRSIARESERMERLVGDLLDSSAIESGILRLQRDWCDLELVLEAAVDVVAGDAVRVHIAEGQEPVWGDHDRLEQVLVNLIENAVTHGGSPDGVDVTFRPGERPGTVEIEVRDHGRGIPHDMVDRIFEPRIRGATDVGGVGLGLPIARGIVEAHGGTLDAVAVEPGACFVVALPTEPPDGVAGPVDASWTLVEGAMEPDVV
jgi:signal transduction histidine kinase